MAAGFINPEKLISIFNKDSEVINLGRKHLFIVLLSYVFTAITFLYSFFAKQIVRGELWTSKARENDLRVLLLRMMEWHAKALHGNDYDVWHGGTISP